VDAYLDARGLRRSNLFHQLLQALIELAPAGSEERALLESISNHLDVRGAVTGRQAIFATEHAEDTEDSSL
jgi:putative DNA methylase